MMRPTSRSRSDGRVPRAASGTGSRGTTAGSAVARARLVDVRDVLQVVALPHLAAPPALEVPDEIREQAHRDVGIHERDAELLGEHEQVDGVVVTQPHFDVFRVEVEEEEAPERFLDDIQGAPPAAHASPRRGGWPDGPKRFPPRPKALGRAGASARAWRTRV